MKRVEIIIYLESEEIEGLSNDEIGDVAIDHIVNSGYEFECRVLD